MQYPQPPRPQQWEAVNLLPLHVVARNEGGKGLVNRLTSRLFNALKFNKSGVWKKSIELFLRQRIHQQIDQDEENHKEWKADRLLGVGGFGTVGLWICKDALGQVVDEIVVKESVAGRWAVEYEEGYVYNNTRQRTDGVTNEAVIQSQMDEKQSANLVRLRGYAVIQEEGRKAPTGEPVPADKHVKEGSRRYRLYMEYAPYGDLERLKSLYKARNQLLPEPFLWHVFDSLAAVCKDMAEGVETMFIATQEAAATSPELPVTWGKEDNLVHFDIKPSNIFLGYEMPMDGLSCAGVKAHKLKYPTVKLGDFGIATMTGPEDGKKHEEEREDDNSSVAYVRVNPNHMWKMGTPGFMPPEQVHYGIDFEDPPNSHKRLYAMRPGNPRARNIIEVLEKDLDLPFVFGSHCNVWSIGKTMYDLATLSELQELSYCWAHTDAQYRAYGRELISNDPDSPFMQSLGPAVACPYSEDLMKLIKACLRPEIRDRIDANDLYAATQAKVRALGREIDDAVIPVDYLEDEDFRTLNVKEPDLYYEGSQANPISDLPYSDREFDLPTGIGLEQWYFELKNVYYRDPDRPEVKFGEKFGDIPKDLQSHFQIFNDEYHLDAVNGEFVFGDGVERRTRATKKKAEEEKGAKQSKAKAKDQKDQSARSSPPSAHFTPGSQLKEWLNDLPVRGEPTSATQGDDQDQSAPVIGRDAVLPLPHPDKLIGDKTSKKGEDRGQSDDEDADDSDNHRPDSGAGAVRKPALVSAKTKPWPKKKVRIQQDPVAEIKGASLAPKQKKVTKKAKATTKTKKQPGVLDGPAARTRAKAKGKEISPPSEHQPETTGVPTDLDSAPADPAQDQGKKRSRAKGSTARNKILQQAGDEAGPSVVSGAAQPSEQSGQGRRKRKSALDVEAVSLGASDVARLDSAKGPAKKKRKVAPKKQSAGKGKARAQIVSGDDDEEEEEGEEKEKETPASASSSPDPSESQKRKKDDNDDDDEGDDAAVGAAKNDSKPAPKKQKRNAAGKSKAATATAKKGAGSRRATKSRAPARSNAKTRKPTK